MLAGALGLRRAAPFWPPGVGGTGPSLSARTRRLTRRERCTGAQVKRESGTFAKERLVAPPTEVYSLHRRLAGAFSTCIQLEARIPCRDLLEAARDNYDRAQ